MNEKLNVKQKIGWALVILLSIGDLTNLASLGQTNNSTTTNDGPPPAIIILDVVFALLSLVGAWFAIRKSSRTALRVVAVARILSMITALPAFFVGGVPAGWVAAAAGGVVLTIVALALIMNRRPTEVSDVPAVQDHTTRTAAAG